MGFSPFCRLRPLDVEFMKALHEKVNIVPVLAKADTLTPSEVKKKKIKASLLTIINTLYIQKLSSHHWTTSCSECPVVTRSMQ